MDFSWIFYAIVLFVTGGICFLGAITALVRLDQASAKLPPDPQDVEPPPPRHAEPLTRLGRPVRQIQLV